MKKKAKTKTYELKFINQFFAPKRNNQKSIYHLNDWLDNYQYRGIVSATMKQWKMFTPNKITEFGENNWIRQEIINIERCKTNNSHLST